MDTRAPVRRGRRPVALAVLATLAVGSGVTLAVELAVPSSPARQADPGRPLSSAEARRLAAMRITNYRDGRVGVRGTTGSSNAKTQFAGWVDWGRSLIYLGVGGPGAGGPRELLQAVPGVLASRPEAAGATPTRAPRAGAPLPPRVPPSGGWRVRRLDAGRAAPLDAVVALLFGIAAERPDSAAELARSASRWLGSDRAGATSVDVLLGPANPVPASTVAGRSAPARTSLTEMGGAVRYWLDRDARLHRFEALLFGDVPVQVEIDRTARADLVAIDALGGRPVRPRAVTDAEADRLARMRPANRARGGAEITLAVPTLPAANLRGAGWVDWRNSVAYLSLGDVDRPADLTLLRANADGVATRDAPPRRTAGRGDRSPRPSPTAAPPSHPAPPPLPPPTDVAWAFTDWNQRGDALGGLDLDLLISEALSSGRSRRDDAGRLRSSAVWLRTDAVDGRPVAVFEMPKPAEAGEPPGRARLRYWVDAAGILRRLELRTRTGAFAQLDLDPGPVPSVRRVPLR